MGLCLGRIPERNKRGCVVYLKARILHRCCIPADLLFNSSNDACQVVQKVISTLKMVSERRRHERPGHGAHTQNQFVIRRRQYLIRISLRDQTTIYPPSEP